MIFHRDTVCWFCEALGRLWDNVAKAGPQRTTRISQNWLATPPRGELPWAQQWAGQGRRLTRA